MTIAKKKPDDSAPVSETGEMPHIPRVIDYAFKVDCTLHLENETQVRREIEGKWCAIHVCRTSNTVKHRVCADQEALNSCFIGQCSFTG